MSEPIAAGLIRGIPVPTIVAIKAAGSGAGLSSAGREKARPIAGFLPGAGPEKLEPIEENRWAGGEFHGLEIYGGCSEAESPINAGLLFV